LSVRNPAQRLILELCARLADHRVDTLPLGVDGCGIPVYAIPLRSAALSFARLASLEGVEPRDAQALAQVRFAMMSCPEYVGGTGEFDTVFMRAAKGDVTVKSGAEGVHGAAVINRETGLVLKVVDGNARAVAPAALHLLRRLDVLDDAVLREMEPFEHPVVYNRAGRAVGKISPR
ncbi:MAG: asparaginase, partial [Candidatus Baltobacteraceae bacterium]